MRSTTATVASLVRKRSSASTRSVASWITPRSSTTPTTLPKNGRSPRPPANTATPAATASIPMVAIARIVNARRMGCRRAMPSGPAAPPATGGLGGCPGNHGGCGERSGGARRQPRCRLSARSSLLRRAFRHGSLVVAALAALAPRLVRRAHHDYSDRLLGRTGAAAAHHGNARRREGDAGEAAREPLRCLPHLDRRRAARGGARRLEAGARGQALHGAGPAGPRRRRDRHRGRAPRWRRLQGRLPARRLPAHGGPGQGARRAARAPRPAARRRPPDRPAPRGRAQAPGGAARVRAVRRHVPLELRPARAAGPLRPLRRAARAARRRPREDRPPPHGGLRARDRTRARALPCRRPPLRDRRHRQPRGRLPARGGERVMILLKSKDEIEHMRRANVMVAEILAEVRAHVRPGVATAELDALAEELTLARGARPAFKGYTVAGRVFPASICISINDEVVHGVPSRKRTLREGDIVGLDFGVSYRGYYGDAALTVPVGRVTPEAERLMEVTRAALAAGIAASQVGGHVGDISGAIQDTAEAAGYSLVREFVGHGIGRSLHEDPQVPNYRTGARGVRLQEGLVLAIEPMVCAGRPEVYVKEDGWTAATRDGRLSAHFEHSVAVTGNGPYILSLP